jgi:hypothetical protein
MGKDEPVAVLVSSHNIRHGLTCRADVIAQRCCGVPDMLSSLEMKVLDAPSVEPWSNG